MVGMGRDSDKRDDFPIRYVYLTAVSRRRPRRASPSV
jgi:hypothetical protein